VKNEIRLKHLTPLAVALIVFSFYHFLLCVSSEMIQSKKELANLTVTSGESWIHAMSPQELRELFTLSPGVVAEE